MYAQAWLKIGSPSTTTAIQCLLCHLTYLFASRLIVHQGDLFIVQFMTCFSLVPVSFWLRVLVWRQNNPGTTAMESYNIFTTISGTLVVNKALILDYIREANSWHDIQSCWVVTLLWTITFTLWQTQHLLTLTMLRMRAIALCAHTVSSANHDDSPILWYS